MIFGKFKKAIGSYEDEKFCSYYDLDNFKILTKARELALSQLEKSDFGKDGLAKTVMDVGCGTGNVLWQISQKFHLNKIVGLDFSRSMLDLAKTKIPDLIDICDSGIHMGQYFHEPTFDLINLHFLFAFLDYQKLIQASWKIMKPGGLLSICSMTVNSFTTMQAVTVRYLSFLLKYLYKIDLKNYQEKYLMMLPKNAQELSDVLERNGYHVLHIETMKSKVRLTRWQDAWDLFYSDGWFTAELHDCHIGKIKACLMFSLLQALHFFKEGSVVIEDESELIVATAQRL